MSDVSDAKLFPLFLPLARLLPSCASFFTRWRFELHMVELFILPSSVLWVERSSRWVWLAARRMAVVAVVVAAAVLFHFVCFSHDLLWLFN